MVSGVIACLNSVYIAARSFYQTSTAIINRISRYLTDDTEQMAEGFATSFASVFVVETPANPVAN